MVATPAHVVQVLSNTEPRWTCPNRPRDVWGKSSARASCTRSVSSSKLQRPAVHVHLKPHCPWLPPVLSLCEEGFTLAPAAPCHLRKRAAGVASPANLTCLPYNAPGVQARSRDDGPSHSAPQENSVHSRGGTKEEGKARSK